MAAAAAALLDLPVGAICVAPLLAVLHGPYARDFPGRSVCIAEHLCKITRREITATDVDVSILLLHEALPGVAHAPLAPGPRAKPVAVPLLADGTELDTCLLCAGPLAWHDRVEKPFFYTDDGAAVQGQAFSRVCVRCPGCCGRDVVYRLSEIVQIGPDGVVERRAYPADAVHPEWFAETSETVVELKLLRRFEAFLAKEHTSFEGYANAHNLAANKLTRFVDLSIADEDKKNKHTERDLLEAARLRLVYWRWQAICWAQRYDPALAARLNLEHGEEATDNILRQVYDPKFAWVAGLAAAHRRDVREGKIKCAFNCDKVLVVDGNQKLMRDKCNSPLCAASSQNKKTKFCVACCAASATEAAADCADGAASAVADHVAEVATQRMGPADAAGAEALREALAALASRRSTRSTAAAAAELLEPGTFVVERIVGERMRGREMEYHVWWKGYARAMWTWEPASNINAAAMKEWAQLRLTEAVELPVCDTCRKVADGQAEMNVCIYCRAGLHTACMAPPQTKLAAVPWACAACERSELALTVTSSTRVQRLVATAGRAAANKARKDGGTAETVEAATRRAEQAELLKARTRSCTPRDPPKSASATGGVLGAFTPCGYFWPFVEVIGAEGSRKVLEYLRMLLSTEPEENWPRILVYDDMCHLLPCLRNMVKRPDCDPFFRKLLEHCKCVVDPFHFDKNHVGAWCHKNVNPHSLPELTGPNGEVTNMEVCEQRFSITNKFKHMARSMNEPRFNALLLKIAELANMELDARHELKQRQAAAKAAAAAAAAVR